MELEQAEGQTISNQVMTAGGAYVSGGVQVEGGDFVGRDQVIQGDIVHGNKIIVQATLPATQPISPFQVPPTPERPALPPHFVGRTRELTEYTQQLQASGLVVISGMAGVGKTALAATLAQQIAGPHPIFWHTFHEDEDASVLVWDLAGFLAQQGQTELWAILQSSRQSGSQPPPLPTLIDYLLQHLEGRTYLLCLDDFHYVADDPALADFMERLLRLVAGSRLMVISTLRHVPEFVQSPEPTILGGLNLTDTAQLLAKQELVLTPELTAVLHANTEGNAQFLTLAIDALKRTRTPERLLERLAEADSIERYLLRELDEGLTTEERALLEAIAVLLGYPGTRAAIEAVLDNGRIRRTLRSLCDRHLIAISGDEPDQTYTLHAIVRSFYYEELTQRPKQAMHQRAGEFYAQVEQDLLKAVRHFWHAATYEKAAELATQAVLGLINRGEARPLLTLLTLFTRRQLSDSAWLRLNLARGDVATFVRDYTVAEAGYQMVLAQLDHPASSGVLPLAEQQLLRARACRGMGELLEYEAPQSALLWLQRGLEALAPLTEEVLEKANMYIRLGSVYIAVGAYAEAITAVQQGLVLLPATPSPLHISALINLGYIYFYHQSDTPRALQEWRRGLEICEILGQIFRKLPILINLGIAHYYNGDWDSATQTYQEALLLAEHLGNIASQAAVANSLGSLYTNRGEFALAHATFIQSSELAGRHRLHEGLTYTLAGYSVLLICEEKWAQAESVLQEALALALELQIKYPLPEIYRGWAQFHLAHDDLQQALTFAEKANQTAEEINARIELGISQRVLGQVKVALGKNEEAVAAFLHSLDLLASEVPYEAARTQWVWGTHLLANGDVEHGQARLSHAQATFEKLGVTIAASIIY